MATRTWSGGGADDNWQTAANWDVLPVPGDDLVFAGSIRTSPVQNFPAATSFASITFSSSASVFTLTGNSITLTGNITNSSSNSQNIAIPIILNVATSIINTLNTVTISGIISQSGGSRSIIKIGTGILVLSGVNTYNGTTTINAGAVLINGSISTVVAVNSGGTLGGTGTISGTVAINAGGKLEPGSDSGIFIGTLTTGAVTFNATAMMNVDLNGSVPTADRITSTNTIAINGTLTIASQLLNGAYKSYTIMTAPNITGVFSNRADNSIFVNNGVRYRIVYKKKTVILTQLPRSSGFMPHFSKP